MANQRNGPCPCGSGRKLKKCCLGTSAALAPPARSRRSQTPFTGRYDSVDLLQTAAALFALPENHGKAIRLEELTGKIMASFSPSRPAAPLAELQQFLAAEYAEHPMEDVPVNLFTELVSFDGGDYEPV